MKLRAIGFALWHGLLPWWLYERECHYPEMSYIAHLGLNLRYALRWATGRATWGDLRFEVRVNRCRRKTPTGAHRERASTS